MFKKIFTLLMYLTLILSLTACGGGSATNSSSDGDNSNISSSGSSNNNLKSQIKNCKTILEYDNKTYLNEEIDSITFGVDYTNQPIEWVVLEKEKDKALLLSKYLLRFKKNQSTWISYNDEYVDITWETCTCRKWLNTELVNEIFNEKEKELILVSDIKNTDNLKNGTKGGNNTKDKLFFLSIDEFVKYFEYNDGDYSGQCGGYWWLRSPGKEQNDAAVIAPAGNLSYDGVRVTGYLYESRIRPAMWVKY